MEDGTSPIPSSPAIMEDSYRGPPSTDTAFNKLPIEMNKSIAEYLETDKDIVMFTKICQATYHAINGDYQSFWRTKFREKYAYDVNTTNSELKTKYQTRSSWLRQGIKYKFDHERPWHETYLLRMLADLFKESFQGGSGSYNAKGYLRCLNQEALIDFIRKSRILFEEKRHPISRFEQGDELHKRLLAVKIMCSYFMFELRDRKHNVFGLDEVQQVVYASTASQPLFIGPYKLDINMNWFWNCMDFFRHHMMDKDAATLYYAMRDLPYRQRPSLWQEPIKSGSYPLAKHWKGTYSFLDMSDIRKLRDRQKSGDNGEGYLPDSHIDEGNIQDLELNFVKDGSLPWPDLFEQRLGSLRDQGPPRTRAQSRAKSTEKPAHIQFHGVGEDHDDSFFATGWLNPLPPQHRIPGWQRITLMKHFEEDVDDYLEEDNLWAYEGIVLPGGRIIIGRWWFVDREADMRNDYNGPFIFWAVEPDAEDSNTDTENDSE